MRGANQGPKNSASAEVHGGSPRIYVVADTERPLGVCCLRGSEDDGPRPALDLIATGREPAKLSRDVSSQGTDRPHLVLLCSSAFGLGVAGRCTKEEEMLGLELRRRGGCTLLPGDELLRDRLWRDRGLGGSSSSEGHGRENLCFMHVLPAFLHEERERTH
jgi:hypothetical protein